MAAVDQLAVHADATAALVDHRVKATDWRLDWAFDLKCDVLGLRLATRIGGTFEVVGLLGIRIMILFVVVH
jgi:hypothetical protein